MYGGSERIEDKRDQGGEQSDHWKKGSGQAAIDARINQSAMRGWALIILSLGDEVVLADRWVGDLRIWTGLWGRCTRSTLSERWTKDSSMERGVDRWIRVDGRKKERVEWRRESQQDEGNS